MHLLLPGQKVMTLATRALGSSPATVCDESAALLLKFKTFTMRTFVALLLYIRVYYSYVTMSSPAFVSNSQILTIAKHWSKTLHICY